MTEGFLEVLRCYGQHMTRTHAGVSLPMIGICTALKREEASVSPLGEIDGRRWLLLTRETLAAADGIDWDGKKLEVTAAETICVGREFSHCRAELRLQKESV